MKRTSLTLGFLLVSTALVHAQSEAETAWSAILKDINQSGLIGATAGSVHHAPSSDSLTVENLVYTLSFKLDPEKGPTPDPQGKSKDQFDLEATITLPNVVFKGLKLQDAGYSYDNLTLEGTSISMTIDMGDAENDTRMEVKTVGPIVMTDGYQPFFGEYKVAPSRPIGSTLDYIRPLLMSARYATATSEGMTVDQYMGNGTEAVQTTEIGPFSISGVANGRMERYEVSSQKTQMMVSPTAAENAPNLTAENAIPVHYSIGKTIYQGYDIGALWSTIDPNAPKIEGTKAILEKAEMADAKIDVPGVADIKIGPFVQSDITAKQPKTYLVPLLDELFAADMDPENLPQEKQQALVRAGFDLARSFRMGLMELGQTMADITIPDGPFQGQKASFSLGSIRQAGFSSNGIEESSISGVSYDGPPSMSFKLGRMAIEQLEFADYELIENAIFNSMKGMPPQGSDAAKLGPNALTLALSDFAFDDQKGNSVSADSISLSYDRQGLAIPARVDSKVTNLQIEKSMLQHPLASVFLDQLGLDSLTINEELSLVWDEEKQTYIIEPLMLELSNIASLSGSIGAGGIMRGYLDTPETAQAAMATATVLPSSLELKDLGGLNELINLVGGAMGMGPEQVRSMATMQLQAVLGSFTEPAFSDSVVAEVDRFLKDPQSLLISLNPSAPVPVAQLLGVAATAPQQVPYLLAIGVLANDN